MPCPRLLAEYDSLQTCLQSILKEGLEYSAPLTGSNTQSVQLADLDNDGQDEAIAFFRDSSADSQSLKIYIFRKSDENTYAPTLMIEGNGTAINSAVCCQLEGGKHSMSELLISWQLSPHRLLPCPPTPWKTTPSPRCSPAPPTVSTRSRTWIRTVTMRSS